MNTSASTPPMEQSSISQPRFTILIVDDIPQNIQVAATILRKEGYNVAFSTGGADALSRLESIKPDLILLDVMMPDMDGYEVCQRLKSQPETTHIPVIFLTALNEVDASVKGFELGAVDFVNKPFNPPELMARVRTHCMVGYYQRLLEEKNEILANINATLDFQYADRTEQLEESFTKQQAFSEMTISLVGLMNHEFRTPLTVIQSNAQVLEYNAVHGDGRLDKNKQIDLSRQICSNVDSLISHLNSMSDMLKTHTSLIHEQPVEMMLNGFLCEIVEEFERSHTPTHTFEIILPDKEIVGFIMPDNLMMVVNQLLANAIQYSPSHSTVSLTMIAESPSIRIIVEDEGKGISDDEMQWIYDWFKRGKDETEVGARRGLGVGLAICKLCVETMQGTIHHERKETGGTRCIVTFNAPRLEVSGQFSEIVEELGLV
jgi:two-component system, sensor histidine kinase and response regulator